MLLKTLGFLDISFVDIVDIIMVAAIIYFVLRWLKDSSAINIFVAIILLLVFRIVASAVGMKMMSALLGTIIDVGAIALIVIFQPEIRRFLNNLGRSAGDTLGKRNILSRIFVRKSSAPASRSSISEIAQACKEMSESCTGALIVLLRKDGLEEIMETGDLLDASISCRLIQNIFFKNSPLHDGAMVIGGDRILAARCTLPITQRLDIPANFGMRHKAAIGLSETCDADVVVVSEQTGRISFVSGGKVIRVKDINNLKLLMGGQGE